MEPNDMKNHQPTGIFSWFGYKLPFKERLNAIKQNGFNDISIWPGIEEELIETGNIDKIPIIIDESNLKVECAHAPYQSCNAIWDGTDQIKQQLINEYETLITFCKNLGIPVLVMHASMGNNPPNINEDGLSLMKELIAFAEKLEVYIAIENTRKNQYLDYLFSKISSPFLGFCYDSSHDFLHSSQPTKILNQWGNRLLYTHFSDNDGVADRHWLPTEGIIDWELIKKSFPKDYKHPISLEVVPKDIESEEICVFLRRAYDIGKWLEETLRM